MSEKNCNKFRTIASIFCLCLLGLNGQLQAFSFDDLFESDEEEVEGPEGGHYFSFGPEIYHVHRIKDGGSSQKGFLYGVRTSYDRVKRFSLYWGFEASYASGELRGTTATGSKIISNLTDADVECRFGYTFQMNEFPCASITPFIGLGYFQQTNNFKDPSPMHLHYRDSFKYATAGFFAQIYFTDSFSGGVKFRAKYMVDGKSRVTNDPNFGSSLLLMDEETQYRLDLPLVYHTCWDNRAFNFEFVPFFEYLHYGGRENFPFDFIETQFINIGSRFLFTYLY